MKALIVSGWKQETIPHKGLVKFWENYLTAYEPFFTSHADPTFRVEGYDIVIGHSFGAAAVYRKIQMCHSTEQIKAVFFDCVEEHWKTENLDVDPNVYGVSAIKDVGWKIWKALPPSADVKGANMKTLKYDMGHNELVESSQVHADVAQYMGLDMNPVIAILSRVALHDITVHEGWVLIGPYLDPDKANRDWYEAELKKQDKPGVRPETSPG